MSTHQSSDAYDRIARRWHQAHSDFRSRRFVDELLTLCPPRPAVLDLGCGTGKPIGAYLLERGCRVTGIDASAAMLEIARVEIPGARLIHCDILDYEPGERFEAIVAWDSVFHIPRQYHADVFQRAHAWLTDDGILLISLGASAWEGTAEMLGETFPFSGYEPEQSLELLAAAGLEVLRWEIDDPSSRGHMVALSRRTRGGR